MFYFGNAIGETGDSYTDAGVTQADVDRVLQSLGQSLGLLADADFDRDNNVTIDDSLIAQNNFTSGSTALQLIAVAPLTGTDRDADGLPDEWEMLYFGDLSRDGSGDADGDGFSDLEEYRHGANPIVPDLTPVIRVDFGETYSPSPEMVATIAVTQGSPSLMAVLINTEDFENAQWTPFSPTIGVVVGPGDGLYQVWIGVKDRFGQEGWDLTPIHLDTTPPSISITSPVTASTSQPIIQIQGASTEPLTGISYDVQNSAGSLTGLEGFVLSQIYDTNAKDFTVTSFQCFDVELATGMNTVTIRATDRAGNTSTNAYIYTLDLASDTTPPTITVQWPMDGAQISSSQLTLRGSLDDPTATITVSSPSGGPVQGVVERNGLFWVEDLTLTDGQNTLTLTSTDAAGNSATTLLNLVKTTVDLQIDPVDESQLTGPTVDLTGSVTDNAHTVWVNGVRATIAGPDPEGGFAWQAVAVPLNEGGTAVFQARAIPNNDHGGNGTGIEPFGNGTLGNPTSTQAKTMESEVEKPAVVDVETYSEAWSQEVILGCEPIPRDVCRNRIEEMQWTIGQPSLRTEDCFVTPWDAFPDPVPGPNHLEADYSWPADAWPPTKTGQVRHYDDFGTDWTEDALAPTIPLESCAIGDKWAKPASPEDCGSSDSYRRHAQTTVKLKTGGKAIAKRSALFSITAQAEEILDKRWRPQIVSANAFAAQTNPGPGKEHSDDPLNPSLAAMEPTTEAIPPSKTRIGALGNLGDDGYLFKVLPDNQTFDVTPRAKTKFYRFTLDQVKHRLLITANGVPIAADRAVTDAEYCVGQRVEFVRVFVPIVPTLANRTTLWNFSGTFVNDYWQHFGTPPGPPGGPPFYYGSKNYYVNSAKLGQESTLVWWVSGAFNPPATYAAKVAENLTFANGQQAVVASKGLLHVYRPEVQSFTDHSPFTPQLSPRSGVLWLQLGGEGGQGSMAWRLIVKRPKTFTGYMFHTQLINRSSAIGHFWGTENDTTSGEYWLDTSEDYVNGHAPLFGTLGLVEFLDLPGYDTTSAAGFIDVVDVFKAYCRFIPDPQETSIPITVGLIIWGWSARADEVNQNWSLTRAQVTSPSFGLSEDFPEWLATYYANE